MTPPDDHEPPDQDLYEETPPRSIFAATWFRALLVLIVLGVIGAVAVPYILDAMNPPPPKPTIAARSTPPPMATPPSAVTPTPAPPPASTPATTATPAPSPPPSSTSSSLPPSTVSPAITDKALDAKPAPADKAEKAERPKAADKAEKPKIDKTDRADKVGQDVVASATTKAPAKSATKTPVTAKSEPTKTDDASATSTSTVVASKPAPAATKRVAAKATPPSAPKATASGDWWVQVGAFRDAETAKKLTAKLREQNYPVDESSRDTDTASKATASDKPAPSTAPAGSDQYDVFVAGGSAADLNKRLSGKGLAAEASGNGVVVRPSLPLRDAVALSKDLAIEGFKVQVRRAGAADTAARPAAEKPTPVAGGGGESLHRVRVGAFADRATAMTALKDLEGKGYKPFLTRR